MSRKLALVLGTVLVLVVGAVSISLALSDDDDEAASAESDNRFASVAEDDGEFLDGIIGGLDIDPAKILEALADGATLAEVIEDNGGDPEQIADAVEGRANKAIDEALAGEVIDTGEAGELRVFVADTIDDLMNLPIGVLFGDLDFAGGFLPNVPFEALPDDSDDLRQQLEEEFGDGEGGFGFEPGLPFDPQALPEELRERLEGLHEQFEGLDPRDLLDNFHGGGFSFDEGDIPDELRQWFDQFFDGEGFRFDGNGFDFDFRFNEEVEEEAA